MLIERKISWAVFIVMVFDVAFAANSFQYLSTDRPAFPMWMALCFIFFFSFAVTCDLLVLVAVCGDGRAKLVFGAGVVTSPIRAAGHILVATFLVYWEYSFKSLAEGVINVILTVLLLYCTLLEWEYYLRLRRHDLDALEAHAAQSLHSGQSSSESGITYLSPEPQSEDIPVTMRYTWEQSKGSQQEETVEKDEYKDNEGEEGEESDEQKNERKEEDSLPKERGDDTNIK